MGGNVVMNMRANKTAYPNCLSIRSQRDSSSRPWNTLFFQKAIATRKPILVRPYKIIGIHGFMRLDRRKARGRVYNCDGISNGDGLLGNGEGWAGMGDSCP